MAFAPARPTSRKPVHIVPAPKNLHGLGRVLENKIDEALEFDEIPVAAMGLLFEVARERGGEFRGTVNSFAQIQPAVSMTAP